jgi:hypothetical protein
MTETTIGLHAAMTDDVLNAQHVGRWETEVQYVYGSDELHHRTLGHHHGNGESLILISVSTYHFKQIFEHRHRMAISD